MRFGKLFTAGLALSLPATAIAAGSSGSGNAGKFKNDSRAPILSDPTDALGQILALLQSLSALIDPTFFRNVKSSFAGLAATLADPFPSETRALVANAGQLLTEIQPLIQLLGKLDLKGENP